MGRPSIAVRSWRKSAPLQRQQCLQRLLARVVVLGQDQPLDVLAPLAEEHVLGAAQPDALAAEAAGPLGVVGGVGVGPHPQPAHRVGLAMIRCTACTRSSASGAPGRGCLRSTRRPGRARPRPRRGRPARWTVDGDHVPLVHHGAVGGVSRRRLVSTSSSSAPHTHVLPIPRATTAAWLVLPPAAGQDALGGDHAVAGRRGWSPGGPARPSHPSGTIHRRVGVEHRLADGRPGRGGDAPAQHRAGPGGVELREHQLHQLAPDTRRTASSASISPRPPAGRRSGTPRRRCVCRPGSAASTVCRARW